MSKEKCPGCGGELPEAVMCPLSHTIRPGQKLCVECGQKETLDPAWADFQWVGWERADCCRPESAGGK